MATPFNNSLSKSTMSQSSGYVPMDNSASRMALDNLLRRELKVADPGDPQQIAQALLTRYKDNPRAIAINREAQGLPFLLAPAAPMTTPAGTTSSDAELQQAVDDVNRDLQELTTNNILKDVQPELQGWATAIRSAITEGRNSARFALDPRQRDKTFGIRRTLGDYARLARLIGALTPSVSINYRKLAQSLDEVSAVLLVMMGEALANVGFSGGRFLLQAPYAELQVRRDAVIYALRNLIGATQEAYGPNDWPRGLDAYRKLFSILESQGQGDLRALLVENELARTMDELIQRAAHGTAEGLRALGATAQLDLDRLRRLVIIGKRAVNPESPPLTSFLEALLLFADAFNASGGFRLLRIARPPVLFYGLYGSTSGGNNNSAEYRLLNLIVQRGALAEHLDCFMQCGCTPGIVITQILLDKLLYDLDRAIDLYAMGSQDFGRPERRAAVYSYLMQAFIEAVNTLLGPAAIPAVLQPIKELLSETQKTLRPSLSREGASDLLNFAPRVRSLVESLPDVLGTINQAAVRDSIAQGIQALSQGSSIDVMSLFSLVQQGETLVVNNSPTNVTPTQLESLLNSKPGSLTALLAILQNELCIYRDLENRWEGMVKTLAPGCVASTEAFEAVTVMINQAMILLGGILDDDCQDITLPPPYETILGSIAYDTSAIGEGREDNGYRL